MNPEPEATDARRPSMKPALTIAALTLGIVLSSILVHELFHTLHALLAGNGWNWPHFWPYCGHAIACVDNLSEDARNLGGWWAYEAPAYFVQLVYITLMIVFVARPVLRAQKRKESAP